MLNIGGMKNHGRGIRTHFSDDLLWLPYVVCEYIKFTKDQSILEIQVPYRKGKVLNDNEDEKYDKYDISEKQGTIYEHCIKAIEKAFDLGERGLPKIGTGDWNDGFNKIGDKGFGESVWLGFFLYDVLNKMQEICKEKRDQKRVEDYEKKKEQLKKNLNQIAWDGNWYKRAFTDEGKELGSKTNEECRIDSISQSWSVLSKAGENDKQYIAIDSVEKYLVKEDIGIIKLLDPPFDKGKLEPGYIKAYLPGTRENGGQYTHAAIWFIIAETILGFGDKAFQYFQMINPIEHSKTRELANIYKVEPYVIPADIYGHGGLAGRGGWTWYTGSSGWMYIAGISYILGLKIERGFLKIEPCIPKHFQEYEIHFRYFESIYHIKVQNPYKKNRIDQNSIFKCNEEIIEEKQVKLNGEKNVFQIEIIL